MNQQQQQVLKTVGQILGTLPKAEREQVLRELEGAGELADTQKPNQALAAEESEMPEKNCSQKISLPGGLSAIEMYVTVRGEVIRAVLADYTYGKSRTDAGSFAAEFGGSVASADENEAVVSALLTKDPLNPAEKELLKIYSSNFVKDQQGGLIIDNGRVYRGAKPSDTDSAYSCTLVVLPSE